MNTLQKEILSLDHVLSAGDIVNLAMRMLDCMNKEITLHSFRTAYLALHISKFHRLHEDCSVQHLVLMSLLHTIGFFHSEVQFNYSPFDSNPDYFSDNIQTESKYVFASYYLEYMTPLKGDARALAAFNSLYDRSTTMAIYQEEYKNTIYFCARISDFVSKHSDEKLPDDLNELAPGHFDPTIVRAFNLAEKKFNLIWNLKNGNFQPAVTGYLYALNLPFEQTKQLEKILVYFIDFKSTCTMKHCINTSCYAFALGRRKGLNHKDLSSLYTSALLHDIGKMATPQRILEFPGKLRPEDMGIMRHHVNHSKRLLTGFVPDDILTNVYRHHEKLNGSGYPCHIKGDEISLIQRILTVADITSALGDTRSYKAEYPKETIIEIIKGMTDDGELDPEITKYVIEDFDNLKQELRDLQNVLKVDFSKVVSHYNSYIFSNMPGFTNEDLEPVDGLEPMDGLDPMGGLEPVDELEIVDGGEEIDRFEVIGGLEPVDEDLDEPEDLEEI